MEHSDGDLVEKHTLFHLADVDNTVKLAAVAGYWRYALANVDTSNDKAVAMGNSACNQ